MPPYAIAPLSLALVVLGVFVHRRLLAFFPEDPPRTGRHQHLRPTPMAGFLPVLLAVIAMVVTGVSAGVAVGILIASTTGYLDDRGKSQGREMSWRTKGIALAVATALLLSDSGTTIERSWLELGFAFAWIFVTTNAVNFMDNTDGVAAALGALGLLLVSHGEGPVAYAGFAFAGFLLGNWPTPRVFLGDSGSLGLGMCVAWATLPAAGSTQPIWWIALPVGMFVLDFVQVVTARLALGHPPWVGDRRHLTHISMNLGLPRVLVMPVFVALGCGLFFGLRELGTG